MQLSYGRVLRRSALVLMCLSLNGLEVAATPLNEYKRALVEYYGAVGFHPLLLPQGRRVGDVVDIQTLAVVRKQETCFPGLKTEPTGRNVSLPSVKQLENRAASFWVRLKFALGLEMSAEDTRRVLLHLSDVSVEFASIEGLRNALDDRCSELLPVFENNRMARSMGRRVNVIAAILKGRVRTVLSYSDDVQAKARLVNLAKLLGVRSRQLRELSPELEATLGLSGRVNVTDLADEARTVAYQPATIFRPRLGASRNEEIDVEPFDPDNGVHRERLGNLARTWADNPNVGK